MSFTQLKDLLPEAAAKHNLSRQVIAAQVCEKYRKKALIVFGSEALAHTWPKWFKNMVLTVGVENSVWNQEVYFNKEKILREINKEFKKTVVAGMKILVDRREW